MAQVATPVFDPDGGEVAPGDTFELTTSTSGATIYYTYDPDAEPSPTTWIEYEEAVALPEEPSTAITVRAYAIKEGDDDSAVRTVVFQSQVNTPEFDPEGGQVAPESLVEITCSDDDVEIYYTFGDAPPNDGWDEYDDDDQVVLPDSGGQTVTVSAFAQKAPMADSDVASFTFYTVSYSSAVSEDAPAVIDTNATQGLAAVCQGIGLPGDDGDSIDGSRIGGAAGNDLVIETNE